MGCDNCVNLNREEEITTKKEASKSLINDLDSKDIILTEQKKK